MGPGERRKRKQNEEKNVGKMKGVDTGFTRKAFPLKQNRNV